MIFRKKPTDAAPVPAPPTPASPGSTERSPASFVMPELTDEALEALAASPSVQRAVFSFKGREGQRIKKQKAAEKALAA